MTIKISKGLHKTLCAESQSERREAVLFMLGTRAGVITDLAPIVRTSGCEFMPRCSSTNVTKAYLDIVKKRAKPAAFALLQCNWVKRNGWSGDHGVAIYNHMPILLYRNGKAVGRVNPAEHTNIQHVGLSVV